MNEALPRGPIRLLLSDVDGTLVTKQKVLTPGNQAAVHRLREAGILFAITSARPPRGLSMMIEPLAIETPMGGFNGGLIVRPDLTVLEELKLGPQVARSTVDAIDGEGASVWLFTRDEWIIRDPSGPKVDHERMTVGFDARCVDQFTDQEFHAALKIVAVSDDHSLISSCERAVRNVVGDRVNAIRSQPYYLDVTHVLANKGNVVERLSAILSIPTSEIATIGDMENDVFMFKKSGFSIAMGNAEDAVKAQAHAVTGTNEADGVAQAIDRYILPTVVIA